MNDRFIVWLIIVITLLCVVFVKKTQKKLRINAKFITGTAIFGAMSIILYVVPVFNLSLPFFPGFLNVHFDEIPAFIAGFAYGPLSAIIILVIKTLAKLPSSHSMCVGELADIIYSLFFILPAVFIYHRKITIKSVVVGFSVATVIQILAASLITSFAILSFYINVMELSEETIIDMCHAVNPNVNSLGWTFFFLVGIPFNAFKDIIVVIVTFILYKRLHSLIDRINEEA